MKKDSFELRQQRKKHAFLLQKRKFRKTKTFRRRKTKIKKKMWYRGEYWTAILPSEEEISYLPEVLCFEKNPQETISAFATVRERLHKVADAKYWFPQRYKATKPVKIDSYFGMEKVSEISTSAALVLAAEYERRERNMAEPPAIFELDRWDDEILYKLLQIGFFESFGYNTHGINKISSSDDVFTVPFYSGTNAQMRRVDQKLVSLLEYIDPNITIPRKLRVALNSAVGEALTNTREHAYVEHDFKYPHVGLWWATGAASRKRRQIVISLFDQGVTIPINYPKLPFYALIRDNLPLLETSRDNPYINDAVLIQAAAKHGKSGRETNKGGLGLPQMKDAINLCGDGALMILSRGGKYTYTLENGKEKETLSAYECSIGGTLIEWKINIPE